MTREIKFKVWNKDEKHFMVGWECAQLVIRPLSGRVTDGATTPNVELLQYTGLKDSKGVEIYEGDIVEHTDDADTYEGSTVVFDRGQFCFEWDFPNTLTMYEDLEVVGNIYESEEQS